MSETREQLQFKKMTETKVSKLILTLGLPTTISMLITNIYNMADTYFVAKISIAASGATGVVFAIQCILQAFGFMYGHGAGSNISRQLGSKRYEEAKTFASTSFFLAILTGVLILVFGFLFLEPLMYLLGSTDTILPHAKSYATYILIAGPAMASGCVLNNILRYEGKATYAMFGLTSGGIINMILDPILIFIFDMGIGGAGLATAISQYISVIILLIPYLTGKTVTKINIKFFTKKFEDIVNIIFTGMPSFARQTLGSLSTTFLNRCAKSFGDAAIAAMSVVARCSNFIFAVALGVAQGYQPVAAYNYGAKRFDRVKQGAIFTMAFASGAITIFSIICGLNAEAVISIFRKETEVITIGATSLRYLCISLPLLPFISVANMMFQSTGNSGRALWLACCQSGLIYIPMILILSIKLGLFGIEISQAITYGIATIITIPFVISFFKELDRKMAENGN